MKHTELPWKVGYITAENEIDFEVGVETVEDNYWIGSTGLEEEPTGEANAEFICRACNSHYALLGACKGAIGYIETLEDALHANKIPIPKTNSHQDELDMLEQAIAQAEEV